MSAITLKDLPACRDLDAHARHAIQGGGAPWVYGWIRPFVAEAPDFGSPVVYQVNNYYADQMNNQFQVVDINNLAPHSNISVVLSEQGNNTKRPGGA